jgi:hypothetical protein
MLFFSENKQILEYHPQVLQEYIKGEHISFLYPRCTFYYRFLLFHSVEICKLFANVFWLCTSHFNLLKKWQCHCTLLSQFYSETL